MKSLRILIAFVVLSSACSSAQVATGTPPFASTSGGGVDSIDNANLNVHLAIPVFSRPGRSLPFSYTLSYDSSVWFPGGSTWLPVSNWGWRGQSEAISGYISYSTTTAKCYDDPDNPGSFWWAPQYRNWQYHDGNGTIHPFGFWYSDCGLDTHAHSGTAYDGSGLVLNADTDTVTTPSGIVITPPVNVTTGTGTIVDTFGNTLSSSSTNFTDTLDTGGSHVLAISGTNPVSYTYPGPSGNISTAVGYTGGFSIKAAYSCTGVGAYTATGVSLVTSITMPDGGVYGISYEDTPGYSGYKTGRISQITLPTGGKITYSYGSINCTDGSVMSLTRSVYKNSSTLEGTWTYTRAAGPPASTTITDPGGNDTVIDFQDIYETKRINYSGTAGGTVLQTVETCYSSTTTAPSFPCTSTTLTPPFVEVDTRLEFPSGKSKETDTFFNGIGKVTSVKEYDFWTSSKPSNPIRQTVTTYATTLGSVIDRPSTVKVEDGSTTPVVVAETDYTYDQGLTGHHGSPTTITRYIDSTPHTISEYFTYNSNGLVATHTDAGSNVTTYTYGACNSTFPTNVAMPLSLSTSSTWYCGGGVVHTTTDVNSQVTTYTYNDTNRWSPTQVDYPDGGQITASYNFGTGSPWSTTQTQKVTSAKTVSVQSNLDGLGRVYRSLKTDSDTSPTILADTTYDSMGRVSSASNPYVTTSDSTYGTTSYAYDALGRVTTVTNPGGTTKRSTYGSAAVTVSDEGYDNSSHRTSRTMQYDALGRLKSVCELSGGIYWAGTLTFSSTSCNTDISGLSGFTTTYAYDLLNNLTSVSQGTVDTRYYTYDWLSRPTGETSPEAGVTSYTYYTSGTSTGELYQRTRPAPNNPTPPASVTTTYAFDALHRPTGTTYSDSTPSQTFVYDQTSVWGVSNPYGKGRLTQVYSGPSGTSYSGTIMLFDTVGRVNMMYQCTPTTCGTTSYQTTYGYDLAGNLTSEYNALGNYTLNYAYNASEQLTGVTSTFADIYHPGTLATTLGYNPLGQLASGTTGSLTLSRTYDNMGRLRSLSDGNVYSITGTASGNTVAYYPNGNIAQVTDSVNGKWSHGYDEFDRLGSSTVVSNHLLYSEQIDNAAWGKENGATVTANDGATTDPNGGTTADRITATGSYSDVYQIAWPEPVTSGKTYTFSVWLKAPVSTSAAIGIDRCCGYDWEGTSVTVGTTWQRYTFTHDGVWSTSTQAVVVGMYVYGSGNYVWAWGAQLESGGSANTYMATTSTAATTAYSYDYDPYGNRYHENINGTASPGYLFNTHNQITSMTYDALGNIVSDGTGAGHHTYTYDAENRVITVDGTAATYQYDAFGHRIATTVGGTAREFLFDASGRMYGMMRSSPRVADRFELYAGVWHIGTYSLGTTLFNHADWLGTIRVKTDPSGAQASESFASRPFGDCLTWIGNTPCHGDVAASASQFTDQDRDTESGLDHFLFRQYSSTQGRWMTPDPAGMGAVDPSNPQTWNRYAYVGNNPINAVDPLGLDRCEAGMEGSGCDFDDGGYFGGEDFYGTSGDDDGEYGSLITVPGTSTEVHETFFGTLNMDPGVNAADAGSDSFFVSSFGAAPGEGPITASSVSQGKDVTVCPPARFTISGVGPKQAPNTTAISQTPRKSIPAGGVAIKPANFGVPRVNGDNRSILSGVRLYVDWTTVGSPETVPAGLPSLGPYTPVDVIGPASVRNSPGNQIDVYNYTSQTQAFNSSRTATLIAVIPNNSAGVKCPK